MKNIDLIIKRIKNESKAKIIGGFIAIGIILIYCLKAYNEELLGPFGIIVVCILLLLFIVLTIDGYMRYKNPLKKYPGIERMASIVDASAGPRYEDSYIYIIENILIIKARIYDMTYLEDIYAIYREKMTTREIQNIVLRTKYRKTVINVAGMNKDEINNYMAVIKSFCPNAVLGRKAR
ncbi:MAG: hypothetical protein IJ763_06175 [Lachnospiraceae bacterium]|nr:hypothetical protein [Lachnospiraceae bacterium]